MKNNLDEEINELATKCFEINNEVEKEKYFLSQMKILEDIKLEDLNLLISKQFVSKVRKELLKKFPKIGDRDEK